MSAMATHGVAMDCFLDVCKALSSTVRPREAAPPALAVLLHAVHAVRAAHALSLTRVAKFRARHNRGGVGRMVGACLCGWKWILMEVTRLRSGRLSGKKKPTQQHRGTDL